MGNAACHGPHNLEPLLMGNGLLTLVHFLQQAVKLGQIGNLLRILFPLEHQAEHISPHKKDGPNNA